MTPSDSAPDLRRWDFQKTFSAYEIACLIQGIDPLADNPSLCEDDPVFKRIRAAYLHSLFLLTGMPSENLKLGLLEGLCHPSLYKKRNHALGGGDIPDDDVELDSHPRNQLSSVRFERQEVARWLKQLKLNSVYSFQPEEMTPAERHAQIIKTVERHGGNKSAAARELGITQQRVSEIVNKNMPSKNQKKAGAKSSDSGAQALVGAWGKSLNLNKKK
jgi:hypothetical protein